MLILIGSIFIDWGAGSFNQTSFNFATPRRYEHSVIQNRSAGQVGKYSR